MGDVPSMAYHTPCPHSFVCGRAVCLWITAANKSLVINYFAVAFFVVVFMYLYAFVFEVRGGGHSADSKESSPLPRHDTMT